MSVQRSVMKEVTMLDTRVTWEPLIWSDNKVKAAW